MSTHTHIHTKKNHVYCSQHDKQRQIETIEYFCPESINKVCSRFSRNFKSRALERTFHSRVNPLSPGLIEQNIASIVTNGKTQFSEIKIIISFRNSFFLLSKFKKESKKVSIFEELNQKLKKKKKLKEILHVNSLRACATISTGPNIYRWFFKCDFHCKVSYNAIVSYESTFCQNEITIFTKFRFFFSRRKGRWKNFLVLQI